LLAPLALAATFVALVFVVVASSNSGAGAPAKTHAFSGPSAGAPSSSSSSSSERSTYTVRSGDNLSKIASRTGVSLEKLSALNPALDPQALISGECVNLRTRDDCKR